MNIVILKRVGAILCIVVIAIIGVWLGLFGWFGGYITTQRALSIASLIIGIIGTTLIFQKKRLSFLTLPIYLLFSQIVFIFALALGQTLYVAPPVNEFGETFIQALNGEL